MANEKLMILKMLEEGKITAEEASRLLDSEGKKASTGDQTNHTYDTSGRVDSSNRSNSQPGASVGSGAATGSFDDFTADLGRKFETFARDMEPKLQKFTEVFAEKTVNLADKLSKTLNAEAARPVRSPASAPSPAASYGSGMQADFEMPVTPGYNELSIAGHNGETRIKGYNGDKITAKIFYKTKRNGALIELMKLGGKYYLHYDEDDFEKVNVDMYVPEGLFNVVNISNTNGTLDIASMRADRFMAQNINGNSIINGIDAEMIKIECSNGKLDIGSIKGRSAEINNFNGPVEANSLDIACLKLENGNSHVSINIASLSEYSAYLWAVETSNAKMTLNLPTLPELGYHIKAHTSLGNTRLGLTGLNYITNDGSVMEARSIHYEEAAKKMKLSLETSNGGIHVN